MELLDKLYHITTKGLRPFFENAKLVRRAMEGHRGHLQNVGFQEALKKFSEDAFTGRAVLWRSESGNTYIDIKAKLDSHGYISSFLFTWEYDGLLRDTPEGDLYDGEHPQSCEVRVEYVPSHLGHRAKYSKVPYLVCPYTGNLCRTLYTDGGLKFLSRLCFTYDTGKKDAEGKAIRKNTYSYSGNNLSHLQRACKYCVGCYEEEDGLSYYSPQRARGKFHYRGKLTPYGAQLIKFEAKCARAEALWSAWNDKYMNVYGRVV